MAAFGQDRSVEWAAAKKTFVADRARALVPQLERYIRKLAELEKQSAEFRDYTLAGKVQAAASAALTEWADATGNEPGNLAFAVRDAKLASGLILNGEGELSGWENAGAQAKWKVPPGTEAGAYEVSIEYRSGNDTADIILSSGSHQLRRALEPTEDKLTDRIFTALLFDGNASDFSIEMDGKNGANDLFIRNVSVKKLSGQAIGEPDADAAIAAIAALKLLEPKAMDVEQRESAQRLYQELAAVEQRFAAQRNYEAAAAVKEALDALKKVHGPLVNDIAAVQQSKLVLKAKDARTTGAIRYDRTQNALVGWKNAGNAAFWDLQSIDPGRYDVMALYSVSTGRENPGDGRQLSAGGTFIVRQETGLVGDVTERVSHRVASTGDWDKFTSVKCGQMTFSRTSATFVVECGNAEELGVMYLREMELRKVGDGAGGRERNVADQFSSLAAAHLQEVETLLSPIEKVYLAALRKYKESPEAKEEIERKELEIAERRKQMAQSAPSERAMPVGGVHVLSAIDREATYLSGKAVVHSSGEFVTGLRPPDSYVQWNLDRLKVAPGDYDLIVEYRTMDNMGGEFRVQCGAESVDGRVRLSPFGELNQDFRSQRAGKLRVTSGARTIRFEPLDLDSRDGSLCDLRKLTLEPSTGRAVEHVHADGYTEWNGATFADGGDSAGDRFTIRFGGKNYSIRLYAVTCPPGSTSETKSDDFKSVRDHFGVNPNDLARGGRLAAQATADVLGRGPFSVFTKGKKAKDGARFAWVVVENDTLLSGILVGRGLASIDGEESAIPEAIGRGIDGAKYKAWLQSQETEAKAGKEGIWRYHRD